MDVDAMGRNRKVSQCLTGLGVVAIGECSLSFCVLAGVSCDFQSTIKLRQSEKTPRTIEICHGQSK